MTIEDVLTVFSYQEKKRENARIWLEKYLNEKYKIDGWKIVVYKMEDKDVKI